MKSWLLNHRRTIVLFVLSSVCLAVFWLFFVAGKGLWGYLTHSQVIDIHVVELGVAEVENEGYAVFASYVYEIGKKTYYGTGRVDNALFRNPWAAEPHLAEIKEMDRVGYYASGADSVILYRVFPWKAVLNALVGGSVAVYFGVLTYCVSRGKESWMKKISE